MSTRPGTYITFPIERNAEDLAEEAYDYIKNLVPGWEENDGNLDTWLIQIAAAQGSDLLAILTDIPDTLFRYFGRNLIGFPDIVATQAQAPTTWTMIDNAGYTIPEGTQVGVYNDINELVPFIVANQVVVPAGSTVTSAGAVTIVAIEPGEGGSGLGAAGTDVELIDPLDFVSLVELTTGTTGGVDSESDDEYRVRLTRRLRRLSTRPILAVDVADMALEVVGVARVVAIDNYIPGTGGGQERAVAVAGVDEAGANLSSGKKTEIDTLLQANRETNFIFNVMDPSRTTIKVNVDYVLIPGYDEATTSQAVEDALNDYLSPSNWGRDPRYEETGNADTWIETTTIYYNELIQLVSNVPGVDRVATLTYAKNADALASPASIALAVPAALTEPGAINVVAV